MSTFAPPALHGIIGYPLGHSLSPLMHNTAFRTLNLPGVYLSWPIEPGRLPGFVDAARLLNIRGCSITIPHKVDIIPLLDETSAGVKEMGACNTIYRDGEKLCGENTDVIGFMAPLQKRSLPPDTRALVLGAGGVSRAAIAGLHGLCFGALCAIPYFFIGGWQMAFSWWVSGIPYDVIHCVSNTVLVFVLFPPLRRALERAKKTSGGRE